MPVQCNKLVYDRFITYLSKLLLTPPPSCHSVLYILSYKYFVQINHKFYDSNQLYKFLCLTINTKIHEIRTYKEHYGIHEALELLPLESQTSNGQVVKTPKVHKISFFSLNSMLWVY
jgi:hypothetical protein